jgi:hypothetical protein
MFSSLILLVLSVSVSSAFAKKGMFLSEKRLQQRKEVVKLH